IPLQSALDDDFLVRGVQSQHALCAKYSEECRVEPGRLCRGSAGALRRVPHPRNPAFALDNRQKFAGSTYGWRAYNITSDRGTGIGDDEVLAYLAKGHTMGRGTASGPMAEVVDHSLSQMEPADIRALVTYLRSIPAVASSEPATIAPPAPASPK